jgi:hypothetical protein
MRRFSDPSPALFISSYLLILVICLSGAVLTNVSSHSNIAAAENQFSPYTNSSLGFEIQYLSNWKIVEGSGNVTFYPMLQNKSPNGNVTFSLPCCKSPNVYTIYPQLHILVSKAENKTLSQAANELVRSYSKSVMGFRLIKPITPANTNGLLSEVILYTYNEPKVGSIKAVDVLLTNTESNYYISYKAKQGEYSLFLPAAYSMINSVRILAPGSLGIFLEPTLSQFGPTSRALELGIISPPPTLFTVLTR